MASPAARTALTALLPLSLCWGGVASAQQAPAQPAPQSSQQQQPPVAAGTIIPHVFDLPPQPFTLTPRTRYNVTDDDQRISPPVLREDPSPETGCRWSLRGAKIRLRCHG